MSRNAEEARARAEARFRKQDEAARAAEEAKADREAQAHAVEAKTARLKSLRLAQEAANKQAEAAAAPKKRRG